MTENSITRNDLTAGMIVSVNPQSDKTRTLTVKGCIKEILTKGETHPHGILVELDNGEKGRVKLIHDGVSDTAQTTSDIELTSLAEILDANENERVEFKSAALWSTKYTNEDIKNHHPQSRELHKYGQVTSKYIIAKTLAGFLNTDGGLLVVGVLEHKDGQIEMVGIEQEFQNLKDQTTDGYRRMLVDLVNDYFSADIFNRFTQFFQVSFEEIDKKTLCSIRVRASDVRSFLTIKDEELFFIRVDASTRQITGAAMLDYCDKRFPG